MPCGVCVCRACVRARVRRQRGVCGEKPRVAREAARACGMHAGCAGGARGTQRVGARARKHARAAEPQPYWRKMRRSGRRVRCAPARPALGTPPATWAPCRCPRTAGGRCAAAQAAAAQPCPSPAARCAQRRSCVQLSVTQRARTHALKPQPARKRGTHRPLRPGAASLARKMSVKPARMDSGAVGVWQREECGTYCVRRRRHGTRSVCVCTQRGARRACSCAAGGAAQRRRQRRGARRGARQRCGAQRARHGAAPRRQGALHARTRGPCALWSKRRSSRAAAEEGTTMLTWSAPAGGTAKVV